MVEQTIEMLVIWDTIALFVQSHSNENLDFTTTYHVRSLMYNVAK